MPHFREERISLVTRQSVQAVLPPETGRSQRWFARSTLHRLVSVSGARADPQPCSCHSARNLRYNVSVLRFLRGTLPLAALAALAPTARADLVIDDFSQGDFSRVFQGTSGQGEGIEQGLDGAHTLGGSRSWGFEWGGNLRGQDITVANGGGSFAVSWGQGGDPNIGSTLSLAYGHVVPMVVDLSWMTSIEVSRHSDPLNINGTGYSVSLLDVNTRGAGDNQWRQRANEGIGFNRQDFQVEQGFDWTRVKFIQFDQEYDSTTSMIHGYYTDELRVVPEPVQLAGFGAALGLLARRGRTKSTSATERRR